MVFDYWVQNVAGCGRASRGIARPNREVAKDEVAAIRYNLVISTNMCIIVGLRMSWHTSCMFCFTFTIFDYCAAHNTPD